jgi:O-antigen ligase
VLKIINFGATLITIVATPWINTDALIVPKILLLAALAGYLLPFIVENFKHMFKSYILRILLVLSVLFVAQMVAVMFLSSAPIEQEFFGRTGRGLGFLTYISLVIVMIASSVKTNIWNLRSIAFAIFVSCVISSLYSILQYSGIDLFEWQSRTNGIIGTLGNPNFQSGFVAMALIPSVMFLKSTKNSFITIPATIAVFGITLLITESTQGYVAVAAAFSITSLIYLWFREYKKIFLIGLILTALSSLFAVFGMLNRGPLSYYLYKPSVRSRGEMWQTASDMIKDNPYFGVGLDSLGDYSLKYRNEKTNNGIAEYIDNCHNFFLQFAATGGLPLAIIYIFIVILTLFGFIKIILSMSKFEPFIISLFAAWIVFQLQSIISPATIPTLVWNFVISGSIIGLASNSSIKLSTEISPNYINKKSNKVEKNVFNYKISGILLLVSSLFITLPLVNADKMARDANLKGDALLAVKASKKYPESVVRYNLLGADLYQSGLYELSLEIGRSAVKFNPNSYQTWILILVNPEATISEREIAKQALVQIDPLNKVIRDYPIK